MPDTNNKNSESLAARVKPGDVHPALRTPDGQIDRVRSPTEELRAGDGSKPHRMALPEMTEWMRTHEIDSPKPTWKDWFVQEWRKAAGLVDAFRYALSEGLFLISSPFRWWKAYKTDREAWKKVGKQDEFTFLQTGRWYGSPRRLVWVQNLVSAFWFVIAIVAFCMIAGVFPWFFDIK